MKWRIVLATDSLEPSGMGEHMLLLGAALGSEFDLVLAAPENDAGMALLARAARIGLKIKRIDLGRMTEFGKWLQNWGAELVHIHAGIGWEGHGLVRAAKAAGSKVVRTEHLPYLLTRVVQQAEYRAMLLSVDQRIAVSRAVADSHIDKGRGRVAVVRNGITPQAAALSRADTRTELGIGLDDPLILTVARFTPQKGYDLLVDAAAAVLRIHPNARFALVGTGPEQPGIDAAIQSRGFGDKVLMLGARTDVPDLLAAADLFVLPSHFEGLSLALLEAVAARLPVVATTIGGTVEVLGYDYPLLVPVGDSQALSRAIVTALGDPVLAKTASQAARRRFDDRFTLERMARQTGAIYHSLLSAPTLQRAAE